MAYDGEEIRKYITLEEIGLYLFETVAQHRLVKSLNILLIINFCCIDSVRKFEVQIRHVLSTRIKSSMNGQQNFSIRFKQDASS